MNFSLQSLSIENFRAIRKELKIDFTKILSGLYFIAGRNEVEPRLGANGASKSTLAIDTIYWALTGGVARDKRPGADIENWYSDGSTRVVLQFVLDDADYEIERGRNPSILTLNGKTVQQADIDSLLPLADAALRRTLLIDQFGQMFLSLRPEEKSRIFSETLNLSLWLEASDRASEQVKTSDGKIQRHSLDLAGVESAINEVVAHFETARQNEESFEEETKRKLKEARKQRADAADKAKQCEIALNKARSGWEAFGGLDEAEIELNDLKSTRTKTQNELSHQGSVSLTSNRRLDELDKRLKVYIKTKKCPECGQNVSDKHIEERRRAISVQFSETEKLLKQTNQKIKDLTKKLEEVNQTIRSKEIGLVEYHKHLQVVSVAAGQSLNATRELNVLDMKVQELIETANPFTGVCDDLQDRHKKLRARRKELKGLIEELERNSEIYKFWQRGFKEIRLEQIDSTLLELELSANKHAEALGLEGWEIGLSTERETSSGSISHSFTVLLYPPGQKDAISWESYSGGESQRWQLAVTFALSEVLLTRSGLVTDFEVLDEPSIHMSQEGIDDLLACLKDRALELNRRIFVIDHHALDRGSFDGMLTCIKDNKGVRLEADGMLATAIDEPKRERVRL